MSALDVSGPSVPRSEEILTPEALAFVADLDARFHARRDELLGARRTRREEIARTGTTEHDAWLDDVIGLVARVQEPSGYVMSWIQGLHPEKKFAELEWTHEMYVLGHMVQAAVALDRATVFVHPSLSEGFGLPVVEALSFGTPVVHSDAPALLEVAADAGVVVPREDPDGYPLRLAEAIGGLLSDTAARERLAVVGQDRARAFSWRDSAEKVWQLHADL